MAEVRPFRGVHYDRAKVKDLAAVICPPYDIITAEMRRQLYQRSEHNFVRIEFAGESPQDTPSNSKYTRSAKALAEWLGQGILQVDQKPAIYLHDQYFTHENKRCRRRGMTVIVRLEEWGKRVVRPHEGTMTAPKSDRLNLLRALQANTSPVFALFEDRECRIAAALATQDRVEPMLDIMMNGEGHRLWAITEAGMVKQICDSLADQPLYIADGHHRYESALNYRRERRAGSPASADEPFDFVMMTLVDFADPGLVILPTHRLIRGLSGADISGLTSRLKEFFAIEELSTGTSDIGKQLDDLWASEDEEHPRVTMFGPAKGRLHVLTVPNLALASQLMAKGRSDIYRRLNVSVVDHIILERVLGLTPDREAACLGYSHDRQDAVNKVLAGEYQLAFLLSPVKAGAIKAIADISDRMPRKSTYFYPKLPSGLVFYRFG